MARTWSVPQRGNFAVIDGLESRQSTSLLELGNRGSVLLFAVVMTAVGALIPQFDSAILSTLFFMAGAGLAALVVILPWQVPARNGSATLALKRGDGDIPPAFCAETNRHVRFPELFATASHSGLNSGLDRAAWAKLTAHMSHELRTPLNAVLGFSELMTNEVFGPLGSSYSGYARDIHASGRVLLKSAEDALAITAVLTTPERKRARETNRIKAIVDDVCSFAAPDLADRSITVAIDASCDAEFVGDYQATRQMLINLVAEASRHAETGAVLRIDTRASSDAVVLSLSLVSGGSGVQLEEGFGLILARTFCELLGAELTSGASGNGEWSSTVRLPRAAQADLFAAAA
jgi:signal transduction histidine kinase